MRPFARGQSKASHRNVPHTAAEYLFEINTYSILWAQNENVEWHTKNSWNFSQRKHSHKFRSYMTSKPTKFGRYPRKTFSFHEKINREKKLLVKSHGTSHRSNVSNTMLSTEFMWRSIHCKARLSTVELEKHKLFCVKWASWEKLIDN